MLGIEMCSRDQHNTIRNQRSTANMTAVFNNILSVITCPSCSPYEYTNQIAVYSSESLPCSLLMYRGPRWPSGKVSALGPWKFGEGGASSGVVLVI
ncbi:hypothetical protein AVEN_176424-1 [Araneus ventricosus]|uniref:Uncharacterized protein n=1 Tax=Araneus ventricosus TaxID=182803 RepID=A0A4Y2C7N6_ARAVE|nr:hypothetical protein AVEN_176424-1 [Araneus ventricosus]